MIDQNGIKNSNLISSFEQDLSYKSREDCASKVHKTADTEIKIITHIEDFDALEKQWNELAWKSNTDIFQTFEWNRIWWNHFGTNKKLHIFTVSRGDILIGIAPFFEDDVSLFGLKIYSGLRFLGSFLIQPEGKPLVGSISYSDYLGCIIEPGNERDFYQLLLQYFKRIKTTFSEIILDEVSEESGLFTTMVPLLAEKEYGLEFKIIKASSCPIIQLNSTWEAYLKTMSVKDRYNARRYNKRSKKGDHKAFKVEKIKQAEDLPSVLSDFFRMHQLQWNNRGFAGTFLESRMHNFFLEITKSFHKKNWVQFNMAIPIEEETKIVAIDVLITYKNKISLMHRGMDENPLYKKQGPGNVLLYSKLQEAINDGVKVFDMLRGTEEFKLRMATKIIQNHKIIINSDNDFRGLLPLIVKKYLKIKRQLRLEGLHIKIVLGGKPFYKGIKDYIDFLITRIKSKSSSLKEESTK